MMIKKRDAKIPCFITILYIGWMMMNCGCLQDNTEDIPVMTMKQNADDNVQIIDEINKTILGHYISYDDGDTIIIRDIVNKSIYDQTDHITWITFTSLPDNPQPFEGDISYKFQPGDKVDLTVHIQQVAFLEEINNETWTYDLEVFKEGWDSTKLFVPIPQEYLTKTKID